jgi:hypothetical protein
MNVAHEIKGDADKTISIAENTTEVNERITSTELKIWKYFILICETHKKIFKEGRRD